MGLGAVDDWLIEAKKAAASLDAAGLDQAMTELAPELDRLTTAERLDPAVASELRQKLLSFQTLCLAQQQRLNKAMQQAFGQTHATYAHIAKRPVGDHSRKGLFRRYG